MAFEGLSRSVSNERCSVVFSLVRLRTGIRTPQAISRRAWGHLECFAESPQQLERTAVNAEAAFILSKFANVLFCVEILAFIIAIARKCLVISDHVTDPLTTQSKAIISNIGRTGE